MFILHFLQEHDLSSRIDPIIYICGQIQIVEAVKA